MKFPKILGLLFGKSAEPAAADPKTVRTDKDKSNYLIPASRLTALVENVALSKSELKKTVEEGILTERDVHALKFDKVARLIERCSDDRQGEDRIILQRLASSVRQIGALASQSSGDVVPVPLSAINTVMDSGNFLTEAQEYFENLVVADRSNVKNLREDRPQIFFSPDRVTSPLDGLDEPPQKLSEQIGSFRQAWKDLLPDIRAVRPVQKLVLDNDRAEIPHIIDRGYDM